MRRIGQIEHIRPIAAAAFACSLVAVLAACGGGGGGGGGLFGAIAADLNDCTGTSLGLMANAQSEDEAESGAIGQCQGAEGSDCSIIVTFGSAYEGDNQCGAAAIGEGADSCSVFGGSGGSESAANDDALSRCRNAGWECRLPGNDGFSACTG